MTLSWFFQCRYVCHATCLLNSNKHVPPEALLQDSSERAATLWQSNSACHITSPDSCKQPAAEIESEKREARIKKQQALTEGPRVRAPWEKYLSIFKAGQGRERKTSGIQHKTFNGWLNQGTLTATAWSCCQITQSAKFSTLQEELTWDGLFYPSKGYSSGSFCDLGGVGEKSDIREYLGKKKSWGQSLANMRITKLSMSMSPTKFHSKKTCM